MIIGILGGMGPSATCDFFKKIIDLTPATKDQEHLHVIIDNNVSIPDRTAYILGTGENPTDELRNSAQKLETMGADYIAIPCNTAHYFYDSISDSVKNAKVLNMIEETAIYLKENLKNKNNFLLLATKGTYSANVYKKVFNRFDLNIIIPDEKDQEEIMSWIYGVKSGSKETTKDNVEKLSQKYMIEDDTPIILGCTELPLLAERIGFPKNYIDPVTILAKKCVALAKENIE